MAQAILRISLVFKALQIYDDADLEYYDTANFGRTQPCLFPEKP